MWNFLWHLRGSISLDGVATNEAALDRLAQLLDSQRKPVTERNPAHVVFEAPLWRDPFGPNWLAMGIYDQGRFWIEQGRSGRRLRYDLRSLHGMVFCLFAATTFFLFAMASGGLLDGLRIAALAFGWLYGMNILLALARVPRSIGKAVRTP